MKIHKIKSVMLTSIRMTRFQIITKETVENYYKGNKLLEDSVGDDLECLFQDLQLEKEPSKLCAAYFLPKLAEDEMELIKKVTSDGIYPHTFQRFDPVGVEDRMKRFKSDATYVEGFSLRHTTTIENYEPKVSYNFDLAPFGVEWL